MFCTEAEQMEQEFDRLTEQMALAAEQQAAAQKEGNTAKAQIAEKKQQNEEKNAALQTLNDTIAQVKADIEKTEGRIRLAEEQSQNDAANLTRMEKEVAAKEKQQAEKQQETEVCRSRITALKMTMDREQEQLDTLEASYENLSSTLQLHESRAESFKDEIFEQIRIGTEAKGEIAKREAMMEQFSSRKEQLETEIAHTQSRLGASGSPSKSAGEEGTGTAGNSRFSGTGTGCSGAGQPSCIRNQSQGRTCAGTAGKSGF